jgi:NhaP-type Na+/H+ or K+/H+ antiporter
MDLLSAYSKAIAISIILIVSYFFNQVSKKYNIPSVILLIGLGIGVKEFLLASEIDISSYLYETLELLGIVGLIMIVLEASLELKLNKEKKRLLIQSFALGALSLAVTAFATAYLLHQFLIDDFFKALMYAIPFSILSSAIIIPSLTNLSESKREFMIYESTFSDILGIMVFYFLIENVELQTSDIVMNVSGDIVITIVASFILSYGLVLLLQYLDAKVKLFFLIAILVLLYSIGKIFHLSSLLIIMVFGLVLNNHDLFFRGIMRRWIHRESIRHILEDFHVVTMESSFVVRTFFFVVFGMSLDFSGIGDMTAISLGLGILLVVYLVRMFLFRAIVRKHIYPQVWIAPRGLVTILLFFSIPAALQDPNFSSTILMIVILVSGIIMSVALVSRKEDFEEMETLSFDDWNEIDKELEKLNPNTKQTGSDKKEIQR